MKEQKCEAVDCQRINCGRKAFIKIRCGFHWFWSCKKHMKGQQEYYDDDKKKVNFPCIFCHHNMKSDSKGFVCPHCSAVYDNGFNEWFTLKEQFPKEKDDCQRCDLCLQHRSKKR